MSELKINISKKMPEFTLRANIVLHAHKRASLTAPSGFGKSTFLRILAGLLPLNEGSLFLGSKELTPLPPHLRNCGFIFQESALFPSLTVLENCAFGLMVRHMPLKERRAIAFEFLKKLGLESLSDRSIEKLSGGEKQRISLIRTFIWKPDYILLDEPFSALDEKTKNHLKNLLIALHEEHPVPFLLVTHDEKDANDLTVDRFYIEGDHNRRIVSAI